MRSLFAKILLWFLLATAVTITGFVVTTAETLSAPRSRAFPMGMLVTIELREARHAYERWGRDGLAEVMDRLAQSGQESAYLTDGSGRDLLTGEDHSALLAAVRRRPGFAVFHGGRIVVARPSDDGRYWYFLMLPRRRWFFWFLHPQYLWILAPIVLFCYLLARYLTAPVRQLQRAVIRFGQGNFSARAGSARQDELGELARTFDQMAERIQTLMTAERRLLLDISHELRSPLARLNLAVELARSGEDREAALNRVEKEADRLNACRATLIMSPLALDRNVP